MHFVQLGLVPCRSLPGLLTFVEAPQAWFVHSPFPMWVNFTPERACTVATCGHQDVAPSLLEGKATPCGVIYTRAEKHAFLRVVLSHQMSTARLLDA